MLTIKNLKVKVEGKEILKGINLEVKKGETHAIMGPNGSGKSTLAAVLAGRNYMEITEGEVYFNNENLLMLKPEERAQKGLFLGFQYPIEIPGVTMINFLKTSLNEIRKAQNLEPLNAVDFLKFIKEKKELVPFGFELTGRHVNEGFSGGEKKKNEVFQMLVLNPTLAILDEIDSGLDIDALKVVANAINNFKNDENAVILITHYQRLLNYVIPDFVHIFYDGKIIKSGDKTLAFELEEKGYDWIKESVSS
ncbi:MAG: Fe-S cluster assembly ATPase SufC [Bacteroidales bacterium]|nr:Fe-S cluster assembly ATPase SufC [Bacteroidales bacterium]